MRSPACLPVFFLIGLCGPAAAQDQPSASYPAMAPPEQYRMADAQAEIALARTAAPPSISADAEVLVLGQRGYEVAVKGKNGFVCFVERSWTAGFDDAEFWNPKTRSPNCFNPAAVRSVLPQYLKRAEWALAGANRQQLIDKTRAAFARHQFTAPAAGSFSFMLSKQGYLSDEAAGPWRPHVMLFVPQGQAAAWGAGAEGSPILGADGSPLEPTVLFIPVPTWSDGSPAAPPTEHHH
jgi:hypothetical protein